MSILLMIMQPMREDYPTAHELKAHATKQHMSWKLMLQNST